MYHMGLLFLFGFLNIMLLNATTSSIHHHTVVGDFGYRVSLNVLHFSLVSYLVHGFITGALNA